jgi:Polyketide cyclase / dehydrase and lipid transport.
MSSVSFIAIVVAALVLLFLLVAALLPKHYSVSVSETINKPQKTVYDYVSLFSHQTQYSEWLKADPDLQPTVVGADGTVGAVLKWESHNKDKNKNVGMGEQEIKSMDESYIHIELRLIKPMPATCKLVHHFVEKGMYQTIYTCTFYAYAKFPVNLPSYLFGRRFIIKAQQKTLRNIKAIIEHHN